MSSQAVAWAIVMQAGGPSSKAVLMAIANYANEYGECWASQETLAEGAELKTRQLRTILNQLCERGLIERERRGGEGRGRKTDMLRLRMREIPAMITAKRRPELTPDSNRQSLPEASNRQTLPLAIGGGATGNLGGGNRQIVAGTIEPKNPRTKPPYPQGFEEAWALWPKHVRASDKKASAKRWAKLSATPEAKLAAVKAYLASPDGRKDGGSFVNAFEVWLNRKAEFWLERAAPQAIDYRDALRIWASSNQQFWDRDKYGPAPNEPGYRGPAATPSKAQGSNP